MFVYMCITARNRVEKKNGSKGYKNKETTQDVGLVRLFSPFPGPSCGTHSEYTILITLDIIIILCALVVYSMNILFGHRK